MVVAPRSETEHLVTAFWADVVGRRPRSIDDEFVASASRSPQAGQLLARINERWPVEMTMDEFFAASSVAGLAATIERKIADARTRDSDLLNDVLRELDGWTG
jgi:hypothetical protein